MSLSSPIGGACPGGQAQGLHSRGTYLPTDVVQNSLSAAEYNNGTLVTLSPYMYMYTCMYMHVPPYSACVRICEFHVQSFCLLGRLYIS